MSGSVVAASSIYRMSRMGRLQTAVSVPVEAGPSRRSIYMRIQLSDENDRAGAYTLGTELPPEAGFRSPWSPPGDGPNLNTSMALGAPCVANLLLKSGDEDFRQIFQPCFAQACGL